MSRSCVELSVNGRARSRKSKQDPAAAEQLEEGRPREAMVWDIGSVATPRGLSSCRRAGVGKRLRARRSVTYPCQAAVWAALRELPKDDDVNLASKGRERRENRDEIRDRLVSAWCRV